MDLTEDDWRRLVHSTAERLRFEAMHETPSYRDIAEAIVFAIRKVDDFKDDRK